MSEPLRILFGYNEETRCVYENGLEKTAACKLDRMSVTLKAIFDEAKQPFELVDGTNFTSVPSVLAALKSGHVNTANTALTFTAERLQHLKPSYPITAFVEEVVAFGCSNEAPDFWNDAVQFITIYDAPTWMFIVLVVIINKSYIRIPRLS